MMNIFRPCHDLFLPRYRSHQQCIESEYAETTLSSATGNWTLSESASSVSRNQVPSVISSSIPSSASQYINESISDLHSESVRSHGSGGSKGHHKEKTVVTYFLGLEPIPYRTSLPGNNITLGQFKTLITKKGNYRYDFLYIAMHFVITLQSWRFFCYSIKRSHSTIAND